MNFRPIILSGIILFLGFGAGVGPLQAQERLPDKTYSFDFRGDQLHMVLDKVAREAGIDMAYDPGIVEGFVVYERVQKLSVTAILSRVLADTPLDYIILSTGTIVIVKKVGQNPSYGSYFGRVVEQQTGDPLPGASVMLADASGGTSTGVNGSFSINKLLAGTYTIVFSYVGYEPVAKTVDIRPGESLREEVSLKAKPVDIVPVVVTDHRPQMPYRGGNGQQINPQSPWVSSGKMQDAIRSLNLFQGVQYGLPMTDLHLQGGQPGEHRIRLDGVPVYNPHSFGQMFSAFSPYAISTVQVHKAGYDVTQGSQIAGLIDLKHDFQSSGRTGHGFTAQADPLSVNLKGNLQFDADKEDPSSLNVMGAGRLNYWKLFQEPNLDRTLRQWDDLDPLITNLLIESENDASLYEPSEHRSDVQFNDIHLASRYEVNAYNTLYSSFYVGKNFVSTGLLRQAPPGVDIPNYLYARDEYRWNNLMGQLSLHQLLSPRLDLNSQVSFSSNLLRHRYLIDTSNNPQIPNLGLNSDNALAAFESADARNVVPTQRNNNRIRHLISRSEATYSFNPNFSISGGLQFDYVDSRVDLSNFFYLPTDTDQESILFSGYLEGNWTFGEYWKLRAGNRLTYAHEIGLMYAEPRTSIQFDQQDSDIGYWSLRLSGGLYRQFINQFEITNPGPTSLVPTFTVWSHAGTSEVPKAWHLSSSFYLEPGPHTSLNVESFFKWQPTAYTVSYNNLLQGTAVERSGFSAFGESTQMKSYGAGVQLHQAFAGSRLKLMLGYEYNYSRIKLESQFGKEVPVPWNQPHRFQLRSLWRISPVFTAVAKWQSVYGRSWGFRQSYYNFLSYESSGPFGDFNFNSPENDRLGAFHQLDLSLIYKPSLGIMDLEIRADLVNLLDRRNTIDWSLRPVPESGDGAYEIRHRTMPGFNPSLSIQMDF